MIFFFNPKRCKTDKHAWLISVFALSNHRSMIGASLHPVLDKKGVRKQARRIRLISKGLAKGSRDWRSSFVLLNSAQTLVVTGHQCKVTRVYRQENLPTCTHIKLVWFCQIYPPSLQSETIRKEHHLIPVEGLQVHSVWSPCGCEQRLTMPATVHHVSCDAGCSRGQIRWTHKPRRALTETCTSKLRTVYRRRV